MTRRARLAGALGCLLAACGPGGAGPGGVPGDPPSASAPGAGTGLPSAPVPPSARPPPDAGSLPPAESLPAGVRACAGCHARVTADFLGHAMSDALGPLDFRPTGSIVNPATGSRYAFRTDPDGATWLDLARPDGARRSARVLGRLGAGVFDASLVGCEVDPVGRLTGRLAFLPVEVHPDGSLALAPFEAAGDVGFGQPAPFECLQCHTTEAAGSLPGAALGPDGRHVYPDAQLGADALERLAPLGCAACHGPVEAHAARMAARDPAAPRGDGDDIGLPRLSGLPGEALRDVCARCHLDGEVRIELGPLGYGPQPAPLHALRPTVVPAVPPDAHRFAGQVERLALSACFRASPDMNCTSCHDPHRGVSAQGLAAFERRCLDCHAEGRDDRRPEAGAPACNREPGLGVEAAAGRAARPGRGCIDCHLRTSEPLDLAGVRSVDHWVRRRLDPPAGGGRPRFLADPAGAARAFDDGRLAAALATPAGRQWGQGVVAAWLLRAGRPADAAVGLAALGAPGAAGAPAPGAPSGLPELPASATMHHLRGLVALALGRRDDAIAAWSEALRLDPLHPQARLDRGIERLDAGDLAGALADADALVAAYPRAESGFNLRARALAAAGRLDPAIDALAASTERWALDAGAWHDLGRLFLAAGRVEPARTALGVAAQLQPGRPGLAADITAAGR